MKKLVLFAVGAAMLLAPAVSQAATNFGSRLNHEPANSGECKALAGGCTIVSFIHPSDPNGDPYSGGAPVDGVITKFRIRGFGIGSSDPVDTQVTFRLARFAQATPNAASAVAVAANTGPTVTVKKPTGSDIGIQEFGARVSVAKADHLAIDGTNIAATVNNSGSKFSYYFNPPLVQGQGPRGSTDNTGELLVAATIEPDSDKDGFGDETQDKCPTEPNGGGACSGADRTKPSFRNLRVKPKSFSAEASGGSLVSRVFGTRIGYTLSETATVTFKVQRRVTGRRIGRRCRPATRRNKLRSRRRCARYRTLRGSFAHTGGAGSNSVHFTGRLRGRKLRVGRYRLVARAADKSGNKSAAKRASFRIRR